MPITQFLILKIPTVLLGIIVIGCAVLFAIFGGLLVRRFVPHKRLQLHHDVADPILGALAATYAVLVAFVVVTVWQGFDKSNANVQFEANYLADVYQDSEAFSPEFHKRVGDLVREYRQAIIDKEWEKMQMGEMSPEVEEIMRKIWAEYTTYEPKTAMEKSFFDESVSKLNLLRELRRQRIMDSRTGLIPLLWFVLLAGGLTTISFTFFFGAENWKAQTLMSVLLATTIFLILFAIMEMDFPFTGDIRISPEPFKTLLLD